MKEKQVVLNMIDYVPRNEWGEYIERLASDSSLCTLSDLACGLAVVAAELSEYIGQRGGYGCGDHGDYDALNALPKHKKKIRKALGYSYP